MIEFVRTDIFHGMFGGHSYRDIEIETDTLL